MNTLTKAISVLRGLLIVREYFYLKKDTDSEHVVLPSAES